MTAPLLSNSDIPHPPGWMDAHWMAFSANREFKAQPRMIASAEGCYYTTADGRRLFDGLSGLWCTGLGHARKEIVEAVSRQVATLDYSPAFQFGHPLSFELANRIVEKMPAGLNRVFYTGSGSESADTALKMARAYWRAKGQASKTRLIGRAKGYHGVNFGGISVGGIVGNRKTFGQAVEADHLPHTQPPNGSFHKGMPPAEGPHGAALADELLQLIALHDASNIAAVIVEPFSGSAGVIIPRGGKGLIERISAEARVPVIKHLDGNCHSYVDEAVDLDLAVKVVDNAKTQKYSPCNATESLLVHAAQAPALLPRIAAVFKAKGVEMRGCLRTLALVPGAVPATEEDWSTEYLAPIISIKVVDSLDEAIRHINHYGSHHTDAILTTNHPNAMRFLREVDSASVMVNASTRFADGFEYGLGAEIGISTDKFHARGPVGLEGLTSMKWVVLGQGEVRA